MEHANNLSFALDYAQKHGWKVFPTKPGSKAPIYSGGYLKASNDPKIITDWWTRTPNANIGLACGLSDIAVVDIDGIAAHERWNLIVDSVGMGFVKCAVASTASGTGNHLLYRQPTEMRVKNTTGKIAEHIDTRGDGGYVLLAPSIVVYRGEDAEKRLVPDGYAGSYEWIQGYDPSTGFDEFPVQILNLLKEKDAPAPEQGYSPPKNAMRVLQRAYEKVANAGSGTRNTTLWRQAFWLSHFETAAGEKLDLNDVRETLMYAGRLCGLPDAEIKTTIEKGIRGKSK